MPNTRKKPTAESDGLIVYGLEQRLIRARKERHLSQAQLAEMVGITRATIGAYEAARAAPSAYYLAKIADALHVSADYLLGINPEYEKTIVLKGLTPKQMQAVETACKAITDEFHRINKSLGINPELEEF